ncbi:TonB-dependent receptor [Granulicella sp. dw_53]|uniref:TonB-dependent receptor domain-containing protein n=1 Tax=Granulicella sp. dw_53 TaxID=2719792 RepID=UPI001BD1EEA8|nr:TonB-dependent receptor [Granulicella sp. dw_53]
MKSMKMVHRHAVFQSLVSRSVQPCWGNAFRFFLVLLAALFLPVRSEAQVDTGTIQGTVTDLAGAGVSWAVVTLISEGTGLVMTGKSDGKGLFTFSPLHVGLYSVSAQAKGFGTLTREHLRLDVQQTLVADLALRIGATSETVDVTTSAPVLQTQDASVGQVFESHVINALPLNGRNFTFLAQLQAGVTTSVQDSRGFGLSGSFVANGTLSSFNNYLLDGIENNNTTVDFGNGNAFTVLPPPDAIDQFKVQTTNYSAQFGRAGGAIINAVLKSGANRFYGSAWEYLRNDIFDANDWFLNNTGKAKPSFKRNQFGATIGGPIWHDKVFFFADYQGTRVSQGQAFVSSVPTALERSSGYTNYTDLLTFQTGTQTDNLGRTTPIGTLFDPATTRTTTTGVIDPVTHTAAKKSGSVRDPFPGNIVPASRISPVATKLLNLFPAANASGIVNNYISTPQKIDPLDSTDARVDYNFSPTDQAFVRGSYSYEPKITPAPCEGIAICAGSSQTGLENDRVISIALGETHVFSAHTVNEFRIGYSRIHSPRTNFFSGQSGINAQYGIPGITFDSAPYGGLTQIKIAGLSELGTHNNIPQDEIGAETQYNDNVTIDRGSHIIRFGVEYERLKTSILSAQYPHGNWTFSGGLTSNPAGNAASTGIAQFAIEPIPSTVPGGYPYIGGSSQIQYSPITQQDTRRPYLGVYGEDVWRLTPTFTVNAGLRYEYFSMGTDHGGKASNFVPADGSNPAQFIIDDRSKGIVLSPTFLSLLNKDGIQLAYTSDHHLSNLPSVNLAPRLGVAWQIAPTVVMRVGYGIFYAGIYNRGDGTNFGNSYPFAYNVNVTSNSLTNGALSTDGSIGPLDKGFTNIAVDPSVVQGSTVSLLGIQRNAHVPYVQGINFSMQAQLTPSISYTVGYVATFGRHLENNIHTNRPSVVVPTNVSLTQSIAGVIQPYASDCTVVPGDTISRRADKITPCSLIPYPDFPSNSNYSNYEGTTSYNSLQTTIHKAFTHGAAFLANYTWSKALGDASDTSVFTTTTYRAPYVLGWGEKGDKSLLTFNVAHVAHISGTYDLPFGINRQHLNHPGVAESFLGGWSLNGIITLQSGQPFTVSGATSTNNGAGNYALVDTSKLYNGAHTVNHWVNAAAFTNAPVATGPNDLFAFGGQAAQANGPNFHRGDIGLQKQWHIPWSGILEFRAEAFNITNTPNFGQPGSLTPTASNFASITNTRNTPNDSRQLQFAVKYIFGHDL